MGAAGATGLSQGANTALQGHDLLIEREGGIGRRVAKGIIHDAVSAPSSIAAAIGDHQVAAALGQENRQVSATARVLLLPPRKT